MNKRCALLFSSSIENPKIDEENDLNVATSIREALKALGWEVSCYNIKAGGFELCSKENETLDFDFVMLFHAGSINAPDLRYWHKAFYPNTIMLAEGGDEWQCFPYNFPHNRLADCVLSPDCDAVNAYRQNGVNAEWMTHWADERVYHNTSAIPLSERHFDIVTTAVHTPIRDKRGYRSLLDAMAKNGINVHNPTIDRGGYITQEENGDLYRNSKFVFQFSSQGEITRRIFEAAACGCIVFTDSLKDSKNLSGLFPPNSIVAYTSIPHIIETYFALTADLNKAQDLANLCSDVANNNHLAIHRAQQIIDCYLRMKNESR